MFTDWDTGYGIFSFLNNKTTVPWSAVSAGGLDIAYHGEHSGEKFIAPLVYKWVDEDGDLPSAGVDKIVSAISARYYQKWSHLWDVYTAEYSPLNTYNMTESGSRDTSSTEDSTNTRTPNLTEAKTGTDTLVTADDEITNLTHGHVVTDTGAPTSTTTDQVYGFNSADFSNQSKSSTVDHTDNTETNSGIDTTVLDKDKTDTRTYNLSDRTTGTDTNVLDNDETSHEEFSTTKQGTMYRAPGELLSLDREFWLDDYFSIVFADLDKMLTLGIYSEREVTNKVF